MAKLITIVVVGTLLSCMLLLGAAEATLSCGRVAAGIEPCIRYLRGAESLNQRCCNSIRSLNSSAKTTKDRRAVCKCLKAAAGNLRGISLSLAGSLPKKCGVNIPYKITPSIDCNTVKPQIRNIASSSP